MTNLILASNSPRRKQLLALGGWVFRVLGAEIDESPLPGEKPPAYVLRLAESKARAVAAGAPPASLIVAADTTVADDGQILGKPLDAADARRMLQQLRGHAHKVYTAIAVLLSMDGSLLLELGETEVPMRDYSEAEITAYVASGDPLDKAGAYAIQHTGFNPVNGLQGCYANVMGLPLCHLTRALRRLGLPPKNDVPQACQHELGYRCPIYRTILGERS